LRIRKAIGNAALAAAVFAVGSLYLALGKSVTLVVDGRPQTVRTMSANVGELLDTKGIVLDGGDVVEPPPATPLADGMTVVVDTGTSAALAAPQGVGVWVVEGANGPSAKLAGQFAENSFSAGSPGGPTRIVGARVVVKGKEHDVLTNATTVWELLSAMGITPDGSDRVLPPPSTPIHPGALIKYVNIDFRTKRVVTPIPFNTYTTYSSQLPPGAIRIVSHGDPGSLLEIYRVKVVDGKIAAKTLLRRQVLRSAVAARRLVGRTRTTGNVETGEASWYNTPWTGLTAAHPWLPFGTVVTVTNLANGKSVKVVINDRGPFGGRIIDLSPDAFSALASLGTGVIDVRLTW